MLLLPLSVLLLSHSQLLNAQPTELEACGDAYYSSSKARTPRPIESQSLTWMQYTCYDGDFLCPVSDGEPTLRCGKDCYLQEMYS